MLESNLPVVRYPKPETPLESDLLQSLAGSGVNLLPKGGSGFSSQSSPTDHPRWGARREGPARGVCVGGPRRRRTFTSAGKSRLLCRLSYRPILGVAPRSRAPLPARSGVPLPARSGVRPRFGGGRRQARVLLLNDFRVRSGIARAWLVIPAGLAPASSTFAGSRSSG